MSRVVDTRVAEMRFDNRDFEQNVSQSLSTLDKLKEALNFGDAGKSFDNVTKAAQGMNLAGIGDAIDTVKEKFSALEIAGITALVNITNKAVDAGAEIVKSLTIDQVTEGWDKYQTKTSAVATIMAATRHEFTDEAEQMEYVNAQLEKLNWFTDETSFNLVDMVSNIGKFTSAGVALDDAVTAMQGIAEWGYMSGSNINQISHAMYNLSQAMGTGKMQVIDWKSIENANMATMEFKQLAIQAALEMGTLKESVDEFGNAVIETVDTGMAKKFEGMTVTAQNFRDTLSDAWLTSDVMIKAFSEYGNFTELLYEALNATGLDTNPMLEMIDQYAEGILDIEKAAEETGLAADDLKKILDTLSDPAYELGRASFAASQECRTFADVINYTKDAVSTGWMKTFEILLGDYQTVKGIWGDLSDVFYKLFVKSGEARNDILETWAALGGAVRLRDTIRTLYDAVVKVFGAIGEVFHDAFPEKAIKERATDLLFLTQKFQTFANKLVLTDEAAEQFKAKITPLFNTIKSGTEVVRKIGKDLKDLWLTTFERLKEPLTSAGKALSGLVEAGKGLAKHVFEPLEKVPGSLWEDFKGGIESITRGVVEMIGKFTEWVNGITDLINHSEALHTLYAENFKDIIRYVSEFLTDFLSLKDTVNLFLSGGNALEGMLLVIGDKLSLIADTIFKIVGKITGKDLSGVADSVIQAIWNITSGLTEIMRMFPNFVDFEKIAQSYKENGEGLSGVLAAIKTTLSGISEYIIAIIEKVTGADLSGFADSLSRGFAKAFEVLRGISDYVGQVLSGERNPFDDVTGFVDAFKTHIEKILSGEENPFELLSGAAQKLLNKLSEIFPQFGGIDLSGLGTFIDGIKKKIEPITSIFKGFITFAQGVWSVIKGLAVLIEPFVELAGRFLKVIGEKLVETAAELKNTDAQGIFDRLVGAFRSLFEFLKTIDLKDIFEMLKDIGLAALALELRNFFGEIGAVIEQFSGGNSASIFEDLAKSLLMMAGALAVLSLIDAEALNAGLLSLGAIAGGLVGVMFILTRLENGLSGAANTTAIATSLVAIAAAAGILVLALKGLIGAFDGENPEAFVVAFLALIGLMAELVGSLVMLSKNVKAEALVGAAAVLLSIARAVKKLAKVVEELAELDWWSLVKGLGSVSTLLFALYKFLGSMQNTNGLDLKSAASIMVLAMGIKAMAGAVETLGEINVDALVQGLVAVAGVLTEIALFSKYGTSGDKGGLLASSAAMVAVALALHILTPALEAFGEMGWEEIGKSLLELGVILAEVAGAMKLMGDPLTLAGAAGIIAAAAAIRLLTPAVQEFGEMEWEEIGKSLLELGGILAEISVALLALGQPMSLVGAGAILIVAGALAVLNPVIQDFGDMKWEEIGKSLAMLGGMFAVVGAAGLLLAPLTPIILALSAALLGIGAASLLTAEAFKVFVEAAKEGYDLLKEIFSDLAALIAIVTDAVKEAIEFIKKKINDFLQLGSDIIHGFAEGITKTASAIWETITSPFTGLVNAVKGIFDSHSPSRVFEDIGGDLMEGFAIGIDDKKGLVSDAAEGMGDEAVGGIDEAMSKLSEMLDLDMDFEPSISPVLDLDDLQSDAAGISDLFEEEYPVNLTGVLTSVNGSIDGEEVKIDDAGIIDEIKSIRDELNELGSAIHRIRVVLDSGALVGGLIDDIDRALGRREIMAGRGM